MRHRTQNPFGARIEIKEHKLSEFYAFFNRITAL